MNHHRSRRGSARRLAVTALVAAVVVGTPATAFADGVDRLLELSERGGDTVVEVHFDDIVPGDSEEFAIDIRNAGPTPGVLVVDLPRPGLSGDVSRRFYSELVIEGPHLERTRVGDLTVPHTLLLVQRLAPGEQVSVPLRFDFPFESASGNAVLEGEHVVDIDLRVQIVGEDEAPPAPGGPGDTGGTSPGDTGGTSPGMQGEGGAAGPGTSTVAGSRGPLPRTGGDLQLLALAAVVTGLGLTVWVLATRRKEQEETQ